MPVHAAPPCRPGPPPGTNCCDCCCPCRCPRQVRAHNGGARGHLRRDPAANRRHVCAAVQLGADHRRPGHHRARVPGAGKHAVLPQFQAPAQQRDPARMGTAPHTPAARPTCLLLSTAAPCIPSTQVPELEAIIVPVSGGGMVSGIAVAAKALKPSIKIIAAEPAGRNNAADVAACKAAGQLVQVGAGRGGVGHWLGMGGMARHGAAWRGMA